MFADTVALLPDGVTLAIAGFIVFLGGVLRGFIGFGGALVVIPVLASIFTPREAVAIHLVMEVPGTLQLLPVAWRDCDLKAVAPTIAAIVIGTPAGAYLLANLDPGLMRNGIAVAVLMIVVLLARDWRYPGTIGPGMMAGAGFAGGFAQGSTGMGSPPMVVILVARDDNARATRGNVLAVAAGLIAIGVPMQWAYGTLTANAVLLGLLASPIYVLATFSGSRFFNWGGNRVYRLAVLVLLAAMAIYTLVGNS
jgi:uncharacterized protein